ncbi:enoyl-CoA hydratase/isomerase family protein [Weeksella virosa]|uniref:Enoyl-CoA hydratase/isomerase n=1 Tax=Weeksella virosa (strain ATCC 43766 / DSM 16922 / JCM 21250 / CCUG 30538 / CDC 9751 / IAM 14551 / NBRC 16016 / NCTC 11634 / CL345/78) TaxID=865938 RepID=F0P1L0_WEEVC|nr:enoyl-CoA hydratase/isomerase family protein [Weeksella virosa]ADX67638.1 Enoyl-CoA hydratase/isomerase [Weeksella virosa DSM 16922]VEH64737.1 Probable polyketide biosynthesis enoyl-CoA hydratase pksH [Weeksella virosa]
MEQYVNYHIENQIAHVEFYQEKSNSFPTEQLERMIEVLEELGNNDQVKVITLRSKGNRVFSAGASFDELLTIEDFETGKKFFSGFSRVILAMRACPKFIVGAITGKVVGGGVGLVSACDYAIADESAFLRLSELSIGIGPFVIEPAITRKIGLNAFAEMTLNPVEWKDPFWAKEKGFFSEVMETEAQCIDRVEEFSEQLSKYSLEAMRNLKQVFWKDTEDWPEVMQERAAMSGKLVLSDFTKTTLNKFKTKA